jgi:chemotaxis protein CheD
MYRHHSGKFDREIVTIHPGEYFASSDELIIATVLGSCIAVALYDRRLRFGGLNHFMLPGTVRSSEQLLFSETGKYGMFAMEHLVNEMMKLGSRRENLVAKVFGGGSVLRTGNRYDPNKASVSKSNIDFAFTYLETEGIPVDTSDVGGTEARKIYLFPDSFRVLLKRITGKLVTDVEQEEKEYLESIKKKQAPGEDVTLFD